MMLVRLGSGVMVTNPGTIYGGTWVACSPGIGYVEDSRKSYGTGYAVSSGEGKTAEGVLRGSGVDCCAQLERRESKTSNIENLLMLFIKAPYFLM